MDKQKLIHQLFMGKVSNLIGSEKTRALLKEAKEAFDIPIFNDLENKPNECQTVCNKEKLACNHEGARIYRRNDSSCFCFKCR